MAEIINLRQVRKAKARSAQAAKADANRAAFGRTKAEKVGTALQDERQSLFLDGHRLSDDVGGDGGRG